MAEALVFVLTREATFFSIVTHFMRYGVHLQDFNIIPLLLSNIFIGA